MGLLTGLHEFIHTNGLDSAGHMRNAIQVLALVTAGFIFMLFIHKQIAHIFICYIYVCISGIFPSHLIYENSNLIQIIPIQMQAVGLREPTLLPQWYLHFNCSLAALPEKILAEETEEKQ